LLGKLVILDRIGVLALGLCLLALPLTAQDAEPDFETLWQTGSLWEVGDNRPLVRNARKAIVDAGAEGRKFALTKLSVTDSLQVRCLNEVFGQWGAAAYDDLVANIAHQDPAARRNVAEMLGALNDSKAADALLAQAAKEDKIGPRLSQVAALAKWKIEAAVPLIVEISRDKAERIRHRATSLLGAYETATAVNRLIEMLDDAVFYVRDGASAALVGGTLAARQLCLAEAVKQFNLPAAEHNLQRMRLMLPVAATLAEPGAPALLLKALVHESGAVRGDAADALVAWKLKAGLLDKDVDVEARLKQAADAEYDPYARAAIAAARARLADGSEK
jgi:HEAT repeat protein